MSNSITLSVAATVFFVKVAVSVVVYDVTDLGDKPLI